MKGKILGNFFLSTTLLLSISSQNISFAESSGSVGLKSNNYPDEAVEPDKGQEIDTDKKPTAGPFSIAYASDFNFGKHSLPKKETEYFAENDVITLKSSKERKEVQNFIQISDSSGSKEGWKLFVSSLDGLNNSKNSIEGITYRFNHIVVQPITSDNNEFQKPNLLNVPNASIDVRSGAKEEVLVAESKGIEGQGRWHVLFGNNLIEGKQSVSMIIPEGVIKEVGIYESTLLWNFSNAK